MEPKGSLLPSQKLATCPYPEPDQSSPCPHPTSRRSIFNNILQSKPGSSKWSPSLSLPTKILYTNLLSPIHTTCPAHPVSRPYKTGKIIVLYISQSLYFWIANWKTKDSAPHDSKYSQTSICS